MSFSASRSNPSKDDSESYFPQAMDGRSHEEAGQILTELGKMGGIHEAHALVEAAGISRDLDKAAATWSEAIKSFPVIVDRTVKDGISSLTDSQVQHQANVLELAKDIQSLINKSTEVVKASLSAHDLQLKKSRSKASIVSLSGIDLKSLLIGAAATALVVFPTCWFVVVPYMVGLENGSDWALKKYYNSPEGRHAREEFNAKCKGMYPCRKKGK